jgi:hypothetical protein
MTAPRQYTDATDPERLPADPARQPDPSVQQTVNPPAATDPSFAEAPTYNEAPTESVPPVQQQVPPAHAETTGSRDRDDALFGERDLTDLRTRWNDVQAGFVDDPRACVQQADGLVSSAVEQLTASFSHTRSRLEEQWQRGEEASTEDLRIALKQYRDFFDRILSV